VTSSFGATAKAKTVAIFFMEKDKPIKRLVWVKTPTESKGFVAFWRDGSLLYRKLFGHLYIVTATVDCHTTGGSLYHVDPKTIL